MQILSVLLTFIGGLTLGTQSAVNSSFSKKAGVLESTFLTFVLGSVVLFIVVLFFGQGNFVGFFNSPKWQLSAVWFGIGFVFLNIIAVPKIGVIATNVSAIFGQLAMAMVIDHFGLFKSMVIQFDFKRLIALILMVIALRLIYISNKKNEKEVLNANKGV